MALSKKFIMTVVIMCVCSSMIAGLAAAGAYEYKKSGAVEGTEEYYAKKYKLEELKKILVDAVAADTEIVAPEKTLEDFVMDVDAYLDYKIAYEAGENDRNVVRERSQPHIDNIKTWCATHYDAFEDFKDSSSKIYYLDGSSITAAKFYRNFMSTISDEGKQLLSKLCK